MSPIMPGGALQAIVGSGMAVALVVAVLALLGFRPLARSAWGRIALLVAAALLPLSVSVAGLSGGVAESSRTRFCLGCHEMQNHGRSLFVDDRRALAAVHYQNRFVDRDTACFACHTDYALFGDVKAKISGLRHVYVHYLGQVPDRFALYRPYSNQNCLHCHEDARRFTEKPIHQPLLARMESGDVSCLQCHKVGHDRSLAAGGALWQHQ